ncbi:MAG TPA: ArsR family transcriptional regulator [Candidatus Bathyarchaeia archaeon]|nr:ArsR family transcriptional regulator [Candidatus Bathyarchaeia archaeon]
MTEPQSDDIADSENVAAVHPRIDLLKLLSGSDCDGYHLCKELGITNKACFFHLRALEKAGLIGGKIKYHITPRGKQILSRLDGLKSEKT